MSARAPAAAGLAVALAVFAATPPALARARTHVVARGESASSLAKTFYGNASLGDLLLLYNGRSGTVIHPGERLTVPFCAVHRVRSGETWSELAQRFLGRPGAAAALADLNGTGLEAPLRVGATVVVPVVVKHALARGETLAALAARCYGDAGKAGLVARFAGIDDPTRLAVGTVVEIPVVAFRRAPGSHDGPAPTPTPTATPHPTPRPAPTVAASSTPPPEPAPRYAKPLDEAERSFTVGDYDHARQVLEGLRGPVSANGSPEDRRRIARLLAFVYVAFDRDEEACRAYRSEPGALDRSALDPDLVSPRIREVLSRCPPAEPRAGLRRSSDAERSP